MIEQMYPRDKIDLEVHSNMRRTGLPAPPHDGPRRPMLAIFKSKTLNIDSSHTIPKLGILHQ